MANRKPLSSCLGCLVIIVLGIIAMNWLTSLDLFPEPTPKTAEEIAAEKADTERREKEAERRAAELRERNKPIVTKAEYLEIQTGMSYVEVQRIIGQAGEELARNDIAGISNESYMWQNKDGSNMNAIFQDGKLVQKAQFGLK